MLIADAQREVRTVYARGAVGQAVSGVIWLASASLATWQSPRSAIISLVVGGMLIFPLTTLVLGLTRGRGSLDAGNPFRHLGMQVAFVLPLSMLLVAPVAAYRLTLFFPAMLVLVGAHYLPFITLYGMRSFGVLAAAMVSAGVAVAMLAPQAFATGAWAGCAALFAFAAAEGYVLRRAG